MSLPELDQENHRYSSSEWILRAGKALQEAGYLTTEPTGSYDETFAAAVTAFQNARGINEENRVGPFTWDALGIQEESTEVGDLSEDGQWQWDGTEWLAVAQAQPSSQAGDLSEDGQWQWDGAQWLATEQAQAGAVTSIAAGPDKFEDVELAGTVIDDEIEILHQWHDALLSFYVVIKSETSKAAKPDFASAMLKVFTDKILGTAVKEAKAGLVFDILKSFLSEAERAQQAQKSVAIRDFYTTHQRHISNLRKALVDKKDEFVAGVREEADRLLLHDPDSYGMLRMALMDLHQDAEQRLRSTTQEGLFAELTSEWANQQAAGGDLHIRVREADLSVIDVVINAPDGDKLVEQLTTQPGGMDVWQMRVVKVLVFMDAEGHNGGYVRLDAQNRLANQPMEMDGAYKKRYQRLIDHGGLAPVKR